MQRIYCTVCAQYCSACKLSATGVQAYSPKTQFIISYIWLICQLILAVKWDIIDIVTDTEHRKILI